MEKRIGDNLIGNRWAVTGIFEFSEKTKEWEYSCEYLSGKVVWKFRRTGTMVVFVNGKEQMKLPFSIIDGKLHLDLSAHQPNVEYAGYKEAYIIEKKENGEVWFYDLKTKINNGYWLAIVLILE